MRKILFRGKRFDNGEWVEGSLFSGDNGECEICFGTPRVRITYDVDPETVGQLTGLTDKNGKKIFEGDIVRFEQFLYAYIGRIVFNKNTCGFEIWYASEVGGYGARAEHHVNLYHVENVEFIGNIHDNPEMLKGKAK